MPNESGKGVVYHPDYRIITNIDYNHSEDPESGSIITDTQRAFRDRTNTTVARPKIIQGGMGVGVSDWVLANAVSSYGDNGEALGTVSGTGLDGVVAHFLKFGGTEAANIVAALADFPDQEMSQRVIKKYLNNRELSLPKYSEKPGQALKELTICASYAAIKLARKGHNSPVSINLLDKVGMPHLYVIFGAMLAGVDFISMGAGIPDQIPAIINAFLEGNVAKYKIPVTNGAPYEMTFNPRELFGSTILPTKRPKFVPIIGSELARKATLRGIPGDIKANSIDGWVAEGSGAGGHNAREGNRPRLIDYKAMVDAGIPFWIADGSISYEEALSLGAAGIQRGSGFSLSRESRTPQVRKEVIRRKHRDGTLKINTDPDVSPTGFLFKVVDLEDTQSNPDIYNDRDRSCDRGLLVELFQKTNGRIGRRCPAEQEDDYVAKGGSIEATKRKVCLCVSLHDTVFQTGPGIVTLGTNLEFLNHLPENYSAGEYLHHLLGRR